jgi:immune inhibitor A
VRKVVLRVLAVSAVTGLGISLGGWALAGNAPVRTAAPAAAAANPVPIDDLPNPLEEKRRELREQGLASVLNGEKAAERRGASTVVKVGETSTATSGRNGSRHRGQKRAQYVELARETTDRIFVILAEFGNERDPAYPDVDTDPATPGPTRFDGPLHNEIDEPNRAVDNSTVWQADYNRQHYQDLYFGRGESLKNYYEKQSSGRYSVSGTVTDWVRVNFNEARYGRSNGFPCASIVCANTWDLIRDAANTWYNDQIAAGRTPAQVAAEMATFDIWDRYDHDGDGNFNESDGYIDHFQIVHAGGDQADGDPFQGEDAIWSHRWYAYANLIGRTGPPAFPAGGTQIANTGLWLGDYTIQPENGGRSVFYHEYGHDLGLPDDYNIINGGDNNNEHWTLMAQSRLGAKNDQGIGERGGDFGAWNKLQLGWLDYEVLVAGAGVGGNRTLTLGPQEYNSKDPQAVVVVLPKKEVVTNLGAPAGGSAQWWSGDADDYNATLTRSVTLPSDPATLTFQARWNIEDCGPTEQDACDYAYVEVDNGSGFTAIAGNITRPAEHNGIDGVQAAYTTATFDLSAYASQTVALRFRYTTDGAVRGQDSSLPAGIFIDDVAITAGGSTVFSDGAEAGANGWTAVGFAAVGSSVSSLFDHYYIAGHRSYVSYDRYLQTGPYYFGYLNTTPDKVDHYAYQQGLLISYWDTSYDDNDTFEHPGNGRNLYIDSHPIPFYRLDGQPWRARVQVYDAPFGLRRNDSMTLHHNSQAMFIRGQNAQPVFDDTKTWWYAELPNHGVKTPAVGVKIRVLSVNGTSIRIRVTS